MNNPKTEEIVKKLRWIVGDSYFSKCIVEACVLCDTIDLISDLLQELIDEQYRHDRLQDFCVAQGEKLSKLKEQQRWIPVTERLPEVSIRTLVSIDDCVGLAHFIHGNSGKYFFSDYTGKPLTFVTHWMPLPEAQKE